MSDPSKPPPKEPLRPGVTQAILDWHEAVPIDRLAHLVRDAGDSRSSSAIAAAARR